MNASNIAVSEFVICVLDIEVDICWHHIYLHDSTSLVGGVV